MLHRVGRALGVGVPEALGAALILGTYFWAQRFIVPDLGPYWSAAVGSGATGLVMLPVALGGRQSLRPPPGRILARIAAMAAGYQIAAVAFNLGLGSDSPGVVAVIGSLASPVTVLLAFIFLRERLTRLQWLGVGLIFIALVLIAWPG
jgi:drug/metabolite transporter (DMT)-like permease